ncbi:efflux RND transporter periplasmic adaptor subunit, partial [Planctomycetota bacterium]
AQLEKAQLDLERTEIAMPFDGRVVSAEADVGQFVTQGQPIGSVYGTDVMEISVPLKDEELAWFSVPRFNADTTDGHWVPGAPVAVTSSFAGRKHRWEGRIVRMKSRVDAKSRLAHVIVQVDDPFKTETGSAPLLPGLFVEVSIQGKVSENVMVVPRHAIRQGHNVWVARPETAEEKTLHDPNAVDDAYDQRRLTTCPVTILRQDHQQAYISAGLADGAWVITTPLDTVTPKMKIRVKK